jgi:hypothetical protein
MGLSGSGEEKRYYYFNMNATEEWLRYIESRAIMQEYDIKGYSENTKKKEELEEENTKDQDDV